MKQGIKNDFKDNKLRWDLLPLEELEDIVKVYTEGSKKYGVNTWQLLKDGYSRYKAALFRHLVLFEKGEEMDNETGCRHLAQVAWNAIAMLYCSIAAESGTGPLAALIVTVSPLSFMPDSTPIIPAQPMLTKGCPACGRQKVTILWRAKSSPM